MCSDHEYALLLFHIQIQTQHRGNTPGAMVVTDGAEATREKKLLQWAADYAASRAELARAKTELAQAKQEIRTLRAELGVRRMEGAEAEARSKVRLTVCLCVCVYSWVCVGGGAQQCVCVCVCELHGLAHRYERPRGKPPEDTQHTCVCKSCSCTSSWGSGQNKRTFQLTHVTYHV